MHAICYCSREKGHFPAAYGGGMVVSHIMAVSSTAVFCYVSQKMWGFRKLIVMASVLYTIRTLTCDLCLRVWRVGQFRVSCMELTEDAWWCLDISSCRHSREHAHVICMRLSIVVYSSFPPPPPPLPLFSFFFFLQTGLDWALARH